MAWPARDPDRDRHRACVGEGWELLWPHASGVYANFLPDEGAAGVEAAALLLCGLHLLGLSRLARALQAVGGRHDPREDVDHGVAGGAARRLLAHGSSRRLDEGTRLRAAPPSRRAQLRQHRSARTPRRRPAAAAAKRPDILPCQDSAPSWSPNGRYLAFSRGGDFSGEVYLIRPDGTGFRRVTTGAEIDCCVSWTTELAPPSLRSSSPLGSPNGLDVVAFADTSHGWAGGDGILAIADGGSTWDRQYWGPAGIVDLDALDASTVWAVGRDRLLRTTDGGDSWSLLAEPPGWWLTTVRFLDHDVGFGIAGRMLLHGREFALFRTTDGGTTWAQVLAGPSSLYFADSTTGC